MATQEKIPITTYKASGLTARNSKRDYSNNHYKELADTAGNSFIRAGQYTLQGWVQVWNCQTASGLSVNAYAEAIDGATFGDVVLRRATVKKYISMLSWAVDYLNEDSEDDEMDVMDILSQFSFVTEIEAIRYGEKSPKKSSKVDTVAREVARIKAMPKAEQARIRRAMGW